MKEKTKIEASFIESLIESGIEAIKDLLNIEKDENGNFKSFKLIKQSDKGTVYEFEVKVNHNSQEKEKKAASKGKK